MQKLGGGHLGQILSNSNNVTFHKSWAVVKKNRIKFIKIPIVTTNVGYQITCSVTSIIGLRYIFSVYIISIDKKFPDSFLGFRNFDVNGKSITVHVSCGLEPH